MERQWPTPLRTARFPIQDMLMMAQKTTIVGEHTEERDVRREPEKTTYSWRNNSEYLIS